MSTFRQKIEATQAYQQLTPLQQQITGKKNNIALIENGYNVALNKGYDYWANNFNQCARNKEIVKELISNNQESKSLAKDFVCTNCMDSHPTDHEAIACCINQTNNYET